MAIAASFHASYALANFTGILVPVLEKANAAVTDSLRSDFRRALEADGDRVLVNRWQLPLARGCTGVEFTIGELCESYRHETTAQVILPSSVEKVLLGNDGLIRRTGGGRAPFLLQDIQIGYIRDLFHADSETVGPVIVSGRNRLVALQAFLEAVCPGMDVMSILIRCTAYAFSSRQPLEEAIVAANSGRDFPRSEKREKKAAARGLDMSSKDAIRLSLRTYTTQPPAGAVLGTWLKLTASEHQLNTMTPAQIADAGAALVNRLARDVKPEGKTLGAWFKGDTGRLLRLCEAVEHRLAENLTAVANDPAAGSLPRKLADRMLASALEALRA